MVKVYIIGDSHSEVMRHIGLQEKPEQAFAGIELVYKPFGAVKQGITLHHKRQGDTLALLEENWRVKSLPFEASDRQNPEVVYALHLPFNVLPLLRTLQLDEYTTDPKDQTRDFLTPQTVAALVARRNRLGVAMARDMVALGLRTYVFEAPRPFAGHPYVSTNLRSFNDIVRAYWAQTRAAVAAAGARLIEQPAATITADGLASRAELNKGDGQHANPDFYLEQLRLLMQDIQAQK